MKLKWYWWTIAAIVCMVIIVVLKTMSAWASEIKYNTYGPEDMQFEFELQPGENLLQPTHRIWEDGEVELLRYNISFTADSGNSYIIFSAEGRDGAYGGDTLVGSKFVPGENPYYTVPGTGTRNWNIFYFKIKNTGKGVARGTITLTGNRRTVYDPKTKTERPMLYKARR